MNLNKIANNKYFWIEKNLKPLQNLQNINFISAFERALNSNNISNYIITPYQNLNQSIEAISEFKALNNILNKINSNLINSSRNYKNLSHLITNKTKLLIQTLNKYNIKYTIQLTDQLRKSKNQKTISN